MGQRAKIKKDRSGVKGYAVKTGKTKNRAGKKRKKVKKKRK